MILVIYAVVVAIVFGLLTGGSLGSLGEMRLRGEWIILVGLLLQVALPGIVPSGLLSDRITVWLLWFLPGALLAVALSLNWRRFGLALAAFGVVSNLLVVGLNGGMPVLVSAASYVGLPIDGVQVQLAASWLHIPAGSTTVLLYLADVLPLPGPVWFRGLASLGDVLLAAGVMHTVFAGTHEV